MKEQNVEVAKQILSIISKSKKVLMHLHVNPDGDSFGSVLAMREFIESLGKEVTVIKGDSPLDSAFRLMPGFDKVVEKNFFQMDPEQFDTYLVIDTASLSQISKLKSDFNSLPENLNTVCIDHHGSNPKFCKVNFIDSDYPAASQMIFDLLEFWKVKITESMATNLIVGLYTDTGGFKYKPTNSETLRAAYELSRISLNYQDALFCLENSNSEQKLKIQALALNAIKTYFNGNVAISGLSFDDINNANIDPKEFGNTEIANTLKSVIGWNIGVSFFETERGKIRVSMRSRDPDNFDVSKIAVATGFGGGHKAAAGATLPFDFVKSTNYFLDTIKKVYPELGQS